MKLINTALFFLLIGAYTVEGKATPPEPVTVTIQQKGTAKLELRFYSYDRWMRTPPDPSIVERVYIAQPGTFFYRALPHELYARSNVVIYAKGGISIFNLLIEGNTKALKIICEGTEDQPQCKAEK